MNGEFFAAVRRIVEQVGARHVPGAGLDLKDENAGSSSAKLKRVGGLFLTPGPQEKFWHAHWNHVPGAEAYEVQTNPDPSRPWGWSETATVESLSAVVRQSPTHRHLWVRVRAVNCWQRGMWSDPVSISSLVNVNRVAPEGAQQAA